MNKQKWFTYAINFYILVFGMQMTMLGPFLDNISLKFGLTSAQMGTFFTVSMAGFTLAIVLGGVISDRVGKKRVVVWAGFGFVASLLLFALSPWLPFSVLLFFAIGGFGGILEIALSSIVSDINPGNERKAVTFTHVFFGIGAMIGPVFAGWLASSQYPWEAAYYIAALIALLSVLWVIRYEYPPVKEEEKIEMAAFTGILKNKVFLLLCAGVALYSGVEVALWGWTPTYMSTELNYDQVMAGTMVSLLWVGLSLGRLISARLADRFSNTQLVSGLCLVATIGLIAQLIPVLRPMISVSFIVIGFGLSGIWPLVVSQAGTLFKAKYTGTAFGLAAAAGGVGGMIIPLLMGYIAEYVRMGVLIALLGIPLMLISVVSFAATIAERKESAGKSNHIKIAG